MSKPLSREHVGPHRLALGLAAAALLTMLAGVSHLAWTRRHSQADATMRAAARLLEIERRAQHFVSILQSAADAAAALPEAGATLAGEAAALPKLFRALEALQPGLPQDAALTVEDLSNSTVSWAGRIQERNARHGTCGDERRVFVIVGSVSTALVSCTPVRAPDGRPLGVAAAQLPLQVRRNIRNAYLSDFDRLGANEPGVELRYLDVSGQADAERALPPAGQEESAASRLLRSPDGTVLAAVRVASSSSLPDSRALAARYRRAASALACLAALCWTLAKRDWRRLLLGATVTRLLLLALGLPFPAEDSPLLSADTYASTLPGAASRLSLLFRSPIDLLLTAGWTLLLGLTGLHRALGAPARPASWLRGLVADLASFPLLALVFAWVFDTSANCSLDLETISLVPQSAGHFVMHLALLFILGTGAAGLAILMVWAGPSPQGASGLLLRVLGWALLGGAAYRLWPRDLIGLPLLPAVALFALAAATGMLRLSLVPMLTRASAGRRVGLGLTAVAVGAALLYPSLVHFGEKSTRLQIERDHTPLILRQPGWREYVLEEARRKIDVLEVLEATPPGPHRPLLEELAFSVWSSTDLAAFGFSSAVEVQDPEGRVTSRFALNLPSLAAPPALPTDTRWLVTSERLALGSIARPVLHARKLLAYHGELHGAIHVYVGDDFWDLPFLTDRDPYSVLFRSASPAGVRGRPLGLLVYAAGQSLVFSSAERPPALTADLRGRLAASASGRLWTTLPVDGRQTHAYLFADGDRVYGVTYPRLGAGRFAADLAEAAASMTLMALVSLLAVLALRDLLGRRTLTLSALASEVAHRFSLRLFVAFVVMALLPVIVLQLVVREFVAERLRRESERQALELAAIARKAVEDFAWMQRREPGGTRPVTDDALVYIASLVRNDLDVFAGGRLLASSKRELYASGLLPSRVEGGVFRALTLEGQPAALRTETIGGFSYLVVSVPARLETAEPGLLSIPLAPRQREVEAVLDDLYRTIRLASVAFLAAAALLAQSVARRISGPIRDLTAATQRIARGDLAARVAPLSRDELRDLVESFNQMAGDLESQRRDLERSNRLAAWAEMARQVAHEVKNPLTPIQLSAEHLRRVFRDRGADFEQTLERCTDTILKQVATLRRIVTEFSAFARPPATALEPEDMAGVLEDVLAPYLSALPPEVTLRLELAASSAVVRGDRRLLERAVVNLVENALQAVGERGDIAVRLTRREGRVEVEVEDTGPGLDPEIRERIFEPFFSTKTGGSGLGLALVKKIAEDHGGGVSLTSQAGRQTLAVLWLPADREGPG